MTDQKDYKNYEKKFQRRKQLLEAKKLDNEFYDIKQLYDKIS